jgi:shikimate kinase
MPVTHVALVGLMGSGKSAVGERIATPLGLPLVDVDDQIQARTGRSVRDLWEEGGEAAYRPLERSVVVGALAPGSGVVLAQLTTDAEGSSPQQLADEVLDAIGADLAGCR